MSMATKFAAPRSPRDSRRKAYTDKMSELFREAFAGLNISFDYWVRTTDAVHEKFVQQMLDATHARGDIYFHRIRGTLLRRMRAFLYRKGIAARECLPDA